MSGPKFKPGDRVRCVDDSNGGLLTTGRVYEVIDRAPTSGDDFLFVVADDGLEWDFLARRFVPADDPAPVWRTLTFGDLRAGDVVKLDEDGDEETVRQAVNSQWFFGGTWLRTDLRCGYRDCSDPVLVRHPRPEVGQ